MARKYKANRAKARTPYQTYSDWYDKYTKGNKKNWFSDKLSKDEFEEAYKAAKDAHLANPAKAVAQSQEYVDRTFEKAYKKMYGHDMGDIRDKAAREQMFEDYVNDMMNKGMTYGEARSKFEEYFY